MKAQNLFLLYECKCVCMFEQQQLQQVCIYIYTYVMVGSCPPPCCTTYCGKYVRSTSCAVSFASLVVCRQLIRSVLCARVCACVCACARLDIITFAASI